MKGTVNKHGFTLIEVLAVIALIGVLLVFLMPNLVKIFSNSVKSTMKVQENEIKDASIIFLNDFCENKLPGNICPNSLSRNSDNTFSGYVKLQTLVSEDYIDEVSLQDVECLGCVIFTQNKPEVFLSCGEGYTTDSSVDFMSICGLN